MTNQPEWKLDYSTDTEALYIDATGEYDPELALLTKYETMRGTTRFRVHRFGLGPYKIVRVTENDTTTRYLVPVNYEPNWPHAASAYMPWFYNDLERIADFAEITKVTLLRWLCSDDPRKRARAYADIAAYEGADNFDQYPRDLTESAIKNWPDLDGRAEITISTNDDDDGFITLYCNDSEAARDAQSVLDTNWEFNDDQAYCSVTDCPDLIERLEAEGYEVDDSEWSAPDEEDLAYWHAKYERANGATPEKLRAILGWSCPADAARCRRVEQAAQWGDDAERLAFAESCHAAGFVLDFDDWAASRE